MKDFHKLVLATAIFMPLNGLVIAHSFAGMMPGKDDTPAGKPHFERVTKVPYVVSRNGKKSVAETWHGIVIVKTPSGTCIRTERSRLNLVRDGDGYEPEYEEYRRVVPCSTQSLAADLVDSVRQAFQDDAPAAKKP